MPIDSSTRSIPPETRSSHRRAISAVLAASLAMSLPGPSLAGTEMKEIRMTSTEADIAVVKRAMARELGISMEDVKVQIPSASVPGITVFSASANPVKTGRHVSRTGIVQGSAIYVETEAMSRIAKAWNYGVKRTVPAWQVAEVFATLHHATADSAALLDASTLETFKKVSGPKRAAAAMLPAESEVDGLPAVKYCLTSSARSTPFSVVTAIIEPDFKVVLRVQKVLED